MANPQFSLIIPAAGRGQRMRAKLPKPYLHLGKCTVLEHTLSCFVSIPGLKQVIVSTSDHYQGQTMEILTRLFPVSENKVVRGGSERQYSVYNALQEVDSGIDLVAIHDAVRPFVSRNSILRCLEKASESGGAVVGIPVKDTIKRVDDRRRIIDTPGRSELWQAQTPQIFTRAVVFNAYENAMKTNESGTDDASLVEAAGNIVTIVEGHRNNFKLTFPIDFKIAEMLTEKSITD